MQIDELIKKSYNQLTQDELTFLSSLGCGHCRYENQDCEKMMEAVGASMCAYGVWYHEKMRAAFVGCYNPSDNK